MPDYSKNIVYLSQEQYNSLLENQSITVDGVTVTYSENDLYVTPQADPVIDVQVNGTSVVSNGVANVPLASTERYGVLKVGYSNSGLRLDSSGYLKVSNASGWVKPGSDLYLPIVPSIQHEAAFYGLAKAAGADMKDISNTTIGTYPDAQKAAIQTMLGIDSLIAPTESSTMASQAYAINDLFLNDGKLYKATAAISQGAVLDSASNCQVTSIAAEMVRDVQINGTSIINNGVANVPVADGSGTPGVVKLTAGQYGITKAADGYLYVVSATDEMIKSGGTSHSSAGTRPLMSTQQHKSTFYGLAKAAGDTSQSQSNNAVGTYTDSAKALIQHMLGTDTNLADYESDTTADAAYTIGELFMLNGKLHQATAAIAINDTFTVGTNCAVVNAADVFPHDVKVNGSSVVTNGVANVPMATGSDYGVVKLGSGLRVQDNTKIAVSFAAVSLCKEGTNTAQCITPSVQNAATFYGLAKAAGDTTQSSSSNAVGTYTDNAKASIKSMLGIVDGSTGTVDVSGTTPTIAAVENTRYVCGEVATLSFTPPASGISIVRFTSGSTVTILTLPSTVKFPEWFDSTSLETDTIYEICVTDGVYGAVMSWAL